MYNIDRKIFDKDNSSKNSLTNAENNYNVEASKQIKSDTNENKNKLPLTCDHKINKYNYKDNNRQHEGKYIEKSLKSNENSTDVNAKVVNNSMTWQTNTNQNNVENDHLEQEFVENKIYLNDQHHITNNNDNDNANNTRNHHRIQNDNNNSNS